MSPSSPDTHVAVPRWLLLAMGGGLISALVALAFLMGRQSVELPPPQVEVVQAAPAPSSTTTAPTNTAPTTTAPTTTAPTTTAPTNTAPTNTAPTSSAPAAPQAEPSSVPATTNAPDDGTLSNETRRVAGYFARVDQAIAKGKTWSDPNQMAQVIIQDALAGRTDGFDQLVASNRRVHDEISGVSVPGSCSGCRQHHASTLRVLSESIDLLSDLRDATARGDLAALANAQNRAVGLEQKARQVEQIEAEVKERHGL